LLWGSSPIAVHSSPKALQKLSKSSPKAVKKRFYILRFEKPMKNLLIAKTDQEKIAIKRFEKPIDRY